MGPLSVMLGQPISDPGGWVDVNKTTLQHNKYGEISRHIAYSHCIAILQRTSLVLETAPMYQQVEQLLHVLRSRLFLQRTYCLQ